MCFSINSNNGLLVSILISSPPKIVKYLIASSKSFGLFFLQKELNCFFVDWSIKMMGVPLEYFV